MMIQVSCNGFPRVELRWVLKRYLVVCSSTEFVENSIYSRLIADQALQLIDNGPCDLCSRHIDERYLHFQRFFFWFKTISWKKQRSHEKSWEFNLTHDRSFIIPHDVIWKPYATALNVFDHHNLAQNWNYCGALITPDKVLERQNRGSFCLIINNNISLLRLQIVFRGWRTRLFKTNRRVPTL